MLEASLLLVLSEVAVDVWALERIPDELEASLEVWDADG